MIEEKNIISILKEDDFFYTTVLTNKIRKRSFLSKGENKFYYDILSDSSQSQSFLSRILKSIKFLYHAKRYLKKLSKLSELSAKHIKKYRKIGKSNFDIV